MASESVILLVHGMGTHQKGVITKDFKNALTERAKSFGKADDFLNKVDYKEFNYSETFDLIRKQFADNAEARKKGFSYLTGKGFEEKLLKQLTSFEANFGKDEFFYTHWLDVILYSTMYFGEKTRIDFIAVFEKLRKKYGHQNIHIVCHSLGTAVVHDALAKYYRVESDPFDDIADLKTGNFNISSLWTFANVSRLINLLNGLQDPNHSTVVTGDEGCTSHFVNVRNRYDPFTWFKTYDRKMQASLTIKNSVVRKINTHDFYEYITAPKVAKTILGFIYGLTISDSKYKEGEKEYKKGALKEEVKELKEMIDSVADDPSVDSIKDAIEQFKTIQKLIKKLKSEFEDDE